MSALIIEHERIYSLLDFILVHLALFDFSEVPCNDILTGGRHDGILILILTHIESRGAI